MLNISETERAKLYASHALTTDAEGHEVMVGLSHEESLHYVEYCYARIPGSHRSSDTSNHYISLRDKHEDARLKHIAALDQGKSDEN